MRLGRRCAVRRLLSWLLRSRHAVLCLCLKNSSVLAKKPSDVGAFARDFFTQREAIEQYIRNHGKSS